MCSSPQICFQQRDYTCIYYIQPQWTSWHVSTLQFLHPTTFSKCTNEARAGVSRRRLHGALPWRSTGSRRWRPASCEQRAWRPRRPWPKAHSSPSDQPWSPEGATQGRRWCTQYWGRQRRAVISQGLEERHIEMFQSNELLNDRKKTE